MMPVLGQLANERVAPRLRQYWPQLESEASVHWQVRWGRPVSRQPAGVADRVTVTVTPSAVELPVAESRRRVTAALTSGPAFQVPIRQTVPLAR